MNCTRLLIFLMLNLCAAEPKLINLAPFKTVDQAVTAAETRQEQTQEEKYHCPTDVCAYKSRSYSRLPNLKTHLRTGRAHCRGGKYQCEICSKRFTRKSTYDNHQKNHRNPNNKWCQSCGKFYALRSWKNHQLIHTRGRNSKAGLSCRYCKRPFLNTFNCSRHERICDKSPTQSKQTDEASEDESSSQMDSANSSSSNEIDLVLDPPESSDLETKLELLANLCASRELSTVHAMLETADMGVQLTSEDQRLFDRILPDLGSNSG